GVNYFDTAYIYPGSEEAFGKVLAASGLRDQIYIATKLPHKSCKSCADFDRYLNIQLERLQTDHIDYYMVHHLSSISSWQRLLDMGIEKWLAEKQASGQIGQFGFSFHGQQPEFLKLLDVRDWDFCLIQYNYLDENYQAGRVGLQAAHAKQMMTVIMEPLRGGKLATGLPPKAEAAFHKAEPQTSLAAWGLRWIWDQPEPTVVISGMSNMEQIRDNLDTAEQSSIGMLDVQQKELYRQAVEVVESSYKVPCTGCNYCLPCPHGVNIPGCFAAYNTRAAQGLVFGMTQYVTSTSINSKDPESRHGPGRCQDCGVCETKCPQEIAIAEKLREVRKHMEPLFFRPMFAAFRRL
ncbi:MAG: aldo/keto reductase, partial [Coriobacteriales bacterium]|nr:aldo/keto reductase [Coriobacteriales bacterium]